MVHKYGHEINCDLGDNIKITGASHILKNVVQLKSSIPQFFNRNCFRWKQFNGENNYFWEDCLKEEGPLKDSFPGLYMISSLKFVNISNFLAKWNSTSEIRSIWQEQLDNKEH